MVINLTSLGGLVSVKVGGRSLVMVTVKVWEVVVYKSGRVPTMLIL